MSDKLNAMHTETVKLYCYPRQSGTAGKTHYSDNLYDLNFNIFIIKISQRKNHTYLSHYNFIFRSAW